MTPLADIERGISRFINFDLAKAYKRGFKSISHSQYQIVYVKCIFLISRFTINTLEVRTPFRKGKKGDVFFNIIFGFSVPLRAFSN